MLWQRQRSDSRQRTTRRCALARIQLRDRALRARRREAYPLRPWPNAGRAEEGSGLPPHRKFSALQSLENSQNAEGDLDFARDRGSGRGTRCANEQGATRGPRPPNGPGLLETSVHEGSSAGWIASANPLPRRDGEGTFPPCKALKTHKMRKESRFLSGNPILSFPRSSRSPDHPQ